MRRGRNQRLRGIRADFGRARILKILRTIGIVIVAIFAIGVGLWLVAALTIAVSFARLNEINGEIVSSGQKRTYLLHVPTNYDAATPTPLVVSLHGFIEWPAHLERTSGWSALSDKAGFIVVYPSGTGFPLRWHAGGWGTTAANAQADVQFIVDLIDALSREYNIDPARVYANGLSNGGGMAYLLGCALSEKIAAVGGVAGAYVYPLGECTPSRPVPMIVFHGTADRIVPYLGGRSGPAELPNIPDWVAERAGLNGCARVPQALPAVGAITEFEFSGCANDSAVVFYSIRDGGHTWPGGEPIPAWIAGPTSTELNATEQMWAFFRQTSLP